MMGAVATARGHVRGHHTHLHRQATTAAAAFIFITFALALPAAVRARQLSPQIELRPGLVITSSVRILPRIYTLPAPASMDSALIIIRGSDITVDFAGAELRGMDPAADPDLAAGVAIRIEGGSNVTLRNARIRGYKVAVLARGTHDLSLIDNDLGHNWKPRLFSLVEHESLVDWLSFHNNEHDEWLRFGAAAYLADVHGGAIHGNRIEQGMNGIMLVRSDSLRIVNNVVAFNSGIGIGLYRSNHNAILHNHVDYNVRGYSHGFYRRGQDSADLLVYEQSSNNIVAYNSMTHGGDGVFLWAGQSTMDTGQGGANDNLFFGNNFSYAPANGIEATFSRNTFIANRVQGNEHGLWGGYSFESRIIGNDFIGNRFGISIEHGQDNHIESNRFVNDSTAIQVWANAIEPSDWGYPKYRDTRSRDVTIRDNEFAGNRVALRASATRGLTFARNRLAGVDSMLVVSDTVDWRATGNVRKTVAGPINLRDAPARPPLPPAAAALAPPRLRGGLDPAAAPLAWRDRSAIIVDEWGPYSWRYPLLWPADSTRALPLALQVLGPEGFWRVIDRYGIARISRVRGAMNDTILVTPDSAAGADWRLTLEYVGGATESPRGEHRRAGEPYGFSYGRFESAIDWDVRVIDWSDATDPRIRPDAFAARLRATPLLAFHASRLDWTWSSPTIPGVPRERFALRATGRVTLSPGTYTLRTISDDGLRVRIDGRLAIDDWDAHGSRVAYADIAPGSHELEVEYYQVDGWTELRVAIVRGTARSEGSPGPH